MKRCFSLLVAIAVAARTGRAPIYGFCPVCDD